MSEKTMDLSLDGHLARQQSPQSDTGSQKVKIIDKQSIEYIIRSGIAGGIAGSAAKTLIAPLDRIKILFQTSNPDFLKYRGTFSGLFLAGRTIWKNDGIFGLFQGHSVTLLRMFPYAAVKFVSYEQIRTILIPHDAYETGFRRFLTGSLSGLGSVFLTYPLDLIRIRMAFETKHVHARGHDHLTHRRGRLICTIQDIFHETPARRATDPQWLKLMRKTLPPPLVSISNFYRGFAPTILGMIPYAGVSFFTHDLIHDIFRSPALAEWTVQGSGATTSKIIRKSSSNKHQVNSRDSRKPLRAYAQLIAGGLAGMCSQTAAYPFEVIRRRMQVGGAINQGQFLSFKETALLIYRESGFKGYFVGLTIGYMKVIPMAACSFFVYERSKVFLGL